MGQKNNNNRETKIGQLGVLHKLGGKNCTGWGKKNPSPKTSFLMELFLIDFFAEAEQFMNISYVQAKMIQPSPPFWTRLPQFWCVERCSIFLLGIRGRCKSQKWDEVPGGANKDSSLVHFKRSEIWPLTSYFALTLSKGCRKKASTSSRATYLLWEGNLFTLSAPLVTDLSGKIHLIYRLLTRFWRILWCEQPSEGSKQLYFKEHRGVANEGEIFNSLPPLSFNSICYRWLGDGG